MDQGKRLMVAGAVSHQTLKSPPESPDPGTASTLVLASPVIEAKDTTKTRITNLEPVLEGDPQTTTIVQGVGYSYNPKPAKVLLSNREVSRRRSQYFHESLYERSKTSAADAVRETSIILAELKTNVNIRNECQFGVDLSEYLAKRYRRSISSIMVVLEHSKCIIVGGSIESAYTLSITAIPSEVQTATNKRNIVVLQKYMETALRVPFDRGLIRFIPASEECLGWGGRTVAGQVTDVIGPARTDEEKRTQERGIFKSLSLRRPDPTNLTPPHTEPSTPARHNSENSVRLTPTPTPGVPGYQGRDLNIVRKKKSIIQSFFGSSKFSSHNPSD